VQFLCVIQTEESVLCFFRCGVLAQYQRKVPPGSLDSAGRVQLRKQSNQHALSLTNRHSETQVRRGLKSNKCSMVSL